MCVISCSSGREDRALDYHIQAPDGTRVDAEGKRWYPPTGNGILAASQGIYPRKGSVATGDVTTDPAEGIKVSAPDEGEKIVGVDPDAKKVNGTTNGDAAASTSLLYLIAWIEREEQRLTDYRRQWREGGRRCAPK